MRILVFLFLFICLNKVVAQTQPQWKFYIAFEDATGQKDTIWSVWDTLAQSIGVDSIFGEQAVSLNPNTFNVYIFNSDNDTTKTSALDFYGSHQLIIDAINW